MVSVVVLSWLIICLIKDRNYYVDCCFICENVGLWIFCFNFKFYVVWINCVFGRVNLSLLYFVIIGCFWVDEC